MTAQEFIKKGRTFLIITIDDELLVKTYKTNQIGFNEENKNILEINEAEFNDYICIGYNTEVTDLCISHTDYNDGNTHQVLIYDCNDWRSLELAYKKLSEISDKLNRMKKEIDNYINFVYYDMDDKRRTQNN